MVHVGRHRDFFGFNRAKHAVVEAAILATRTDFLPLAEIEAEYRKLAVLVDKTGGEAEHQSLCYPAGACGADQGGRPPMIRVQAPSRLHFGLLSLSTEDRWPDREGQGTLLGRRFGGVGLMVQSPGVCLSAVPADRWEASGALADRVRKAALLLAETLPADARRPLHVHIEQCAPEHAGLGTGTQLELAVGKAVASACGIELDAVELARRLGRGQRSGLGIHGFTHGGFLVDGGKGAGTEVAPLLARHDFPEPWRLVLAIPSWASGLHGTRERQAFQQLQDQGASLAATDALCRLVMLGLLPALIDRDLPAFGEALYDFNARVGEAFASVQGGIYAHPGLAELVAFIRQQGVRGVGQSSWGATVFAIAADPEQAENLAGKVRQRFGLGDVEVFSSIASNRGAGASVEA